MKFGIGIPTCREGRDYPSNFSGSAEMVELSQLAERLGIDYVWGDDHITPGETLLKKDVKPPSFFEVILSMSYVAAATRKIRLGIGVLVIVWRDPVLVAKQIATLDQFSGGRVTLGVGIGGTREEFESVFPRMKRARRGKILDEQLEVLNLLFTTDNASYDGEYFAFNDLSLNPKPTQKPFPFYVTAFAKDTPESLTRMARFASLCAVNPTIESVRNRIEGLKPYLEQAGRDVSQLELTTLPTASIGRTHQEAVERLQRSRLFDRYKGQPLEKVEAANLIGTPAEITEKVKALEKAGLGQCGPQRFAANSYQELKEQVQMFGEEVVPNFR